jgi:hypothetical protein
MQSTGEFTKPAAENISLRQSVLDHRFIPPGGTLT